MTDRPDIRTISTSEIRDRLGDASLTLVDVRPLAAYNGWRLNGETRGGHIPGASAFPIDWLRTVDEPEVARLLAGKGVASAQDVVVYGAGFDDAAALVDKLATLGVSGARVYADGFEAWAADPTLPIDRLPQYQKLVHIDWLRRVLAGNRP